MFFKSFDFPAPEIPWWVAARLYRIEGGSRRSVATGTLAELIWIVLDASESEQADMSIEIGTEGGALNAREILLLADRADFPVVI